MTMQNRMPHGSFACLLLLAGCAMALLAAGCAAGRLAGGLMEAEDSQRLVETPARYPDIENRTFAVVVQSDYATMFEHPGLVTAITSGVSARIAAFAHNAHMLHPDAVLSWQHRTPQWNAMPLGELADSLNVDRVVFVDVLEYRLHPPGNRYLWEGVGIARVGIIERDGVDPDSFSDSFDVASKFPDMEGVGIESATQSQIETGLMSDFVKRIAWLFHLHYEPKHPDKYRPSLDTKEMKELKRATGS